MELLMYKVKEMKKPPGLTLRYVIVDSNGKPAYGKLSTIWFGTKERADNMCEILNIREQNKLTRRLYWW